MPELPRPFRSYEGSEPYVFVSYGRGDADFVYPVIHRLHQQGVRIWYDEGLGFEAYPDVLDAKIRDSAVVLAFFSPDSFRPGGGVQNELATTHRHGRDLLGIELTATDYPGGVLHQFGEFNRVSVSANPDTGEGKLDEEFQRYPVSGQVLARPDVQARPRRPRKRPDRARIPTMVAVEEAFADRIDQSVALVASVAHQRGRVQAEDPAFDPGVFENVLVFHGGGGVGKTGLSLRLEAWASGRLTADAEWGEWPHPAVSAARWDLHSADGTFNAVPHLLNLRRALLDTGRHFYAFDLAFSFWLQQVTPAPSSELETAEQWAAGELSDALFTSLKYLASQAGWSRPEGFTPRAIRAVASQLSDAAALPEVVATCSNPRSGHSWWSSWTPSRRCSAPGHVPNTSSRS